MKNNLFLWALLLVFLAACSSDDSNDTAADDQISIDDDNTGDNDNDSTNMGDDTGDDMDDGISLVGGTWALTDLEIDESIDDLDLDLADFVLESLVSEECYLLTFVFNDDGTMVSTDKLSYIEVDGLSVSCPEGQDELMYEWMLEMDQLTLIDSGEQETITILLNETGDMLTIAGADIDPTYEGANAIFTRFDP
ncbi:MAG: hypothetical protein AAGB24_01185 [Bacteroidota bacterium]